MKPNNKSVTQSPKVDYRLRSSRENTSEDRLQASFKAEAIPLMSALHKTAMHLTRDPNDAKDLVQETYCKAYQAFASYRTGTNCKAWMKRIMKNTFINRYRMQSRKPETVEYAAIEEFYESVRDDRAESSNLEASLYMNLIGDEISQALEELPDHFRTVIILCDIEEYSYEEIADFINCPVGTVRSRIFRSRKMLSELLRRYALQLGYLQPATA